MQQVGCCISMLDVHTLFSAHHSSANNKFNIAIYWAQTLDCLDFLTDISVCG